MRVTAISCVAVLPMQDVGHEVRATVSTRAPSRGNVPTVLYKEAYTMATKKKAAKKAAKKKKH